MTGIFPPTSGTIEFDGTSLVGLAPHEVAELGIARTYQNIRLFADMTVLANVMVGRHVRMKAQWYQAVLGLPSVRREEEETQRKAMELLDLVRLSRRYADELAKNLPYGDQRRLELARALASDPKLLLLDEPTAGMNPGETRQMTDLIARLRRRPPAHDPAHRARHEGRDGRLGAHHGARLRGAHRGGHAEEIRSNPRVIEAYLGKQATA